MRKLVVCAVIIGMLLCGCSNSDTDRDTNDRFITVEEDGYYSILVDTDTDVMYLQYIGGPYKGITVLLNADGAPMLWNGDV